MNQPTLPIRVVVAEDHSAYREMLTEQLKLAPGLEVLGAAQDGCEAIAAVWRLEPNVLTLDLDLPGMSGLDVLRVICWCRPDTKVIILSGCDEEPIVRKALRQGARGFIVKGDGTDLAKAINAVHKGEVWVRGRVQVTAIDQLDRLAEPAFLDKGEQGQRRGECGEETFQAPPQMIPPQTPPPTSQAPAPVSSQVPPASVPVTASLQIEVTPVEAEILVDGILVERAKESKGPVTVPVTDGVHTVAFRVGGATTVESIVVSPQTTVLIKRTLGTTGAPQQ